MIPMRRGDIVCVCAFVLPIAPTACDCQELEFRWTDRDGDGRLESPEQTQVAGRRFECPSGIQLCVSVCVSVYIDRCIGVMTPLQLAELRASLKRRQDSLAELAGKTSRQLDKNLN